MKANELSIGDWVLARIVTANDEKLLTPRKISGIGTSSVFVETSPDPRDPTTYKPIEDIYPIPLTADILERNGFEKEGESPYRVNFRMVINEEDDSVLFVQINKEANLKRNAHISFEPLGRVNARISFSKYDCCVHDLQRAMQMCGIEKKIEL